MAINIQFQNLSQANSEILKAFNSANSAKALEAYQPLDAKQRKLEKLRALQVLKQSSESETLADISLSTTSLSVALQKAEGATLQAMLNLLSAKMIEQNKYTYYDEEERKKLKQKVQAKLDQRQEEQKQQQQEPEAKQEEEEKKSPLDKMVSAALTYFEELSEDLLARYQKLLSALSFDNLRKALAESAKLLVKYAYQVPLEAFAEYIIEPIEDFAHDLREQLEDIVSGKSNNKSKKSFSSKEIKSMLQKSLNDNQSARQEADEDRLVEAIHTMDNALRMQKSIALARRKFNSKSELKLALHT